MVPADRARAGACRMAVSGAATFPARRVRPVGYGVLAAALPGLTGLAVSFVLPTLPVERPGLLFAVLLAAVLLAPILARRVRLPEIVVLLFVGFVIGPTGLGIVERAGVVATLGTVGLLYLMFVAGLELDLDDFASHRKGSAGFGIATFVVPMVLGTVSALALGYGTLASVLLASCWASHTLVAYPVFQRVGTVGNRAVAVSVGATIITDTAALLVLAVIARAHQGALTPVFWATLIPSLALVGYGALRLLPRLASRFFSGLGQDRSLRFLFVMVALFGLASLFEVIGIEAIVGAFVAGLALNRSVPNRGPLMERIDFLGGTLFIPLFLLATGMLIDLGRADRAAHAAGGAGLHRRRTGGEARRRGAGRPAPAVLGPRDRGDVRAVHRPGRGHPGRDRRRPRDRPARRLDRQRGDAGHPRDLPGGRPPPPAGTPHGCHAPNVNATSATSCWSRWPTPTAPPGWSRSPRRSHAPTAVWSCRP